MGVLSRTRWWHCRWWWGHCWTPWTRFTEAMDQGETTLLSTGEARGCRRCRRRQSRQTMLSVLLSTTKEQRRDHSAS